MKAITTEEAKIFRRSRGWSCRKMAEECRVSPPTYTDWEKGKSNNPYTKTLEKIEKCIRGGEDMPETETAQAPLVPGPHNSLIEAALMYARNNARFARDERVDADVRLAYIADNLDSMVHLLQEIERKYQ